MDDVVIKVRRDLTKCQACDIRSMVSQNSTQIPFCSTRRTILECKLVEQENLSSKNS